MELVTIIIPNYNKRNYIRHTLESVEKQTFKDFECIVIDDCSHDDSVSIIKEFTNKDSRFRLIENRYNLGVSCNRNIGLALSKCPYVVTLDSDDYISENFLEGCLNSIINNPNAIMVIPRSITVFNNPYRLEEYTNLPKTYSDVLCYNGIFNCCLYKKEEMILCGMFRDIVAEDWDLLNRFLYKNFDKIVYNKDVTFYYNQVNDSRSTEEYNKYESERFIKYSKKFRDEYSVYSPGYNHIV